MRTFLGAITSVILLLGSLSFVTAGEPEARAIIDKAIQAAGGETNLAKGKAATWKEKGTYFGMGEGLLYTSNLAVQHPNQFRMEVVDVFTIVLNGDKGWTKSPQGVMEMTREELESQQNSQKAGWIASLLPLKDKAFQLKRLAETKVGDKPAEVVQVSRPGYPSVKLSFDKASHLLIKSEYLHKSPDLKFKEVLMEMVFSDHRDVGGAKVPMKIELKRDGKRFVEAEITDYKAAGKLDAKLFAMPK